MKKILLSIAFIAMLSFANKLQAQCNLFPNNLTVNLSSAVFSNGNCQVTADITFDIEHNAGNKKIWINLWKTADYNALPFSAAAPPDHPNPYPSYLNGDMPTLDDLNGTSNTHAPVAVIGIDNDATPVVYFTTYSADPTHITPNTGSSITRTVGPIVNGAATDHFTLTGVTFTSPGACAGLVLQGDIWSSQANGSSPTIHCFASGISFFGDPTINGQISCNEPRKVQVLINSVSTAPLTVNYTVYVDKGVVGTKEPGDPVAIPQTANFAVSAGSPYNSTFLNYTGNNFKPDADQPLLIELHVISPFTKTIYADLFNSCAPLPVNFKSFTAIRNRSVVSVKWETAQEENNVGFIVERLIDNSGWTQVAFIPTQGLDGNSSSDLSYSYNDLNNTKGISQYRIKQVDLDNKAKYTDVRAVRGEEQLGKTIIFPNPSNDGKVNVVFEDGNTTRDISVMDMSGRIVKQFRGVTNNNIQIENLTPGMYSVRVSDRETGAQVVEKIMVNKR